MGRKGRSSGEGTVGTHPALEAWPRPLQAHPSQNFAKETRAGKKDLQSWVRVLNGIVEWLTTGNRSQLDMLVGSEKLKKV